jgi:hypothetical protein
LASSSSIDPTQYAENPATSHYAHLRHLQLDGASQMSPEASSSGNLFPKDPDYVRLVYAKRRADALLRFRKKRKRLTFEKKVRYVSRKRLAENRPRVRGQFVRQPTTPADDASTVYYSTYEEAYSF